MDEIIEFIAKVMRNHQVSWMICGADLNAHFAGSGYPPRRTDDYAASRIRLFMNRFDLISSGERVPHQIYFLEFQRRNVLCGHLSH